MPTSVTFKQDLSTSPYYTANGPYYTFSGPKTADLLFVRSSPGCMEFMDQQKSVYAIVYLSTGMVDNRHAREVKMVDELFPLAEDQRYHPIFPTLSFYI